MVEIKEIAFKSWDEYKSALSLLLEDTHVNTYIFRGQSNSNWTLETSLDRSPMAFKEGFLHQFIELKTPEELLIDEFITGVNIYTTPPIKSNISEIIALMQHHGIPTRALDFTFSPYVASYFAFENIPDDSEHVAIWSMNTSFLLNILNTAIRENSTLIEGIVFNDNKKKYYESDDVIKKIIYSNFCNIVFPLNISSKNKRYNIQQSFMLASGNIKISFIDNLSELINGHPIEITKYILPKNLKKSAMRDLDRMNINAETLFGSIDGFAKRIKQRFENQEFYENITQEFVVRVKKDGGTIEG